MNENILQLIAILKLIWVVCFVALYAFGGIKGKWKRRFVGSAWMGLGVFAFSSWVSSFYLYYLLYPIFLCLALHNGYGGEDVRTKIIKRIRFGAFFGFSALPLLFPNFIWGLYIFNFFLCVMASIFLGVFNIAKNARDEETIIATLSTVLVLFLI